MNTYVVVRTTENSDLYTETFDTYEAALAFVESLEDKCVIVKVENYRDAEGIAASVTVEDHT